jgi:hypothetical protein
MSSIVETLATAILLVLVMIFVLHLINGDAGEWIASKFKVASGIHPTTPTSNAPASTGTSGGNTSGPPIGAYG